MISTIIDRVADILTDSTFVDNLALAGAGAYITLPQMVEVYKHEVESVDQFPCAFVLYDGTPEVEYSSAGLKSILKHRIYVGIVVQDASPAAINALVRGYIDALRPTLNSQIRNGTDIVEGRVVSIERDPIIGNNSGIYTSSFTVICEVLEYADSEAVD